MAFISLRDHVEERLRDDLLHGRFKPGDQIRIAPLAERLSVSMTPAREALVQLQADGWVVQEPNRGFFAAPLALGEAEALYPVLAGMEALAVEFQDPLPSELPATLQSLNRGMREAAGDPSQALEFDRRWHEALVAGCKNPFLLDHLQTVRRRAERYERAYMRHSGRVPGSAEDHERIATALQRSPSELSGLLREHWELSLVFLQEWLSRPALPRELDGTDRLPQPSAS